MSNVRFYRLGTLPKFESSKHVGIFVHLTSETTIEGKTYKKGLWFGGATGWEYLTNDTNAINAAIDAKIQTLDAVPYAQALMSISEPASGEKSSTLTIFGIKEDDGIISATDSSTNKNVNIAIDGAYDESTNKIATQSTVTNAINGLNVEGPIQAVTFNTSEKGNTTLTFNGVKEENGLIAQGTGTSTFIVGDAKLKIQIGSDTASNVFSANAQVDSTIQLDGNVFKKEGDVFSIYTTEGVSSTNPLVTQNDINGLAGAMHYKGGVASVPVADENTKKGDVWVVTTGFEGYEAGDMFIARADGASATFDHVQGNLTLGINSGQIAKNDGNLTPNNMVIATSTGIKTIGISETDLTDTNEKNKRTLTYANGTADTTDGITLYHDVTITDTFKVIGKDFNKTINISSNNRSIEIEKNATDNGILVDLVWNTTMEP